MLERITPVILTLNEEANIARTLGQLQWAAEIVVVDSFSNDCTLSIISQDKRIRVFQRRFDGHAQQWNFAIGETGIKTEWFLALDADYVLTDAIISEIRALHPDSDTNGYAAKFRYCIGGQPLRGSLYPKVTILCRRGFTAYKQDGHTQRAVVEGRVEMLHAYVWHDDRKPLGRWIDSQRRYAALEAQHLFAGHVGPLRFTDRIRRRGWPAPLLTMIYTLIVKGCIFEGWRGWFYVLQRTFAELLIALEVVNYRLGKDAESDDH